MVYCSVWGETESLSASDEMSYVWQYVKGLALMCRTFGENYVKAPYGYANDHSEGQSHDLFSWNTQYAC